VCDLYLGLLSPAQGEVHEPEEEADLVDGDAEGQKNGEEEEAEKEAEVAEEEEAEEPAKKPEEEADLVHGEVEGQKKKEDEEEEEVSGEEQAEEEPAKKPAEDEKKSKQRKSLKETRRRKGLPPRKDEKDEKATDPSETTLVAFNEIPAKELDMSSAHLRRFGRFYYSAESSKLRVEVCVHRVKFRYSPRVYAPTPTFVPSGTKLRHPENATTVWASSNEQESLRWLDAWRLQINGSSSANWTRCRQRLSYEGPD
jgi:outer membrane biosynthesis protein TonB